MMTDRQLREQKISLKALMGMPIFDEAIEAVKLEIAQDILRESNRDVRDSLYSENQLFEKVVARLKRYANDISMEKDPWRAKTQS